MAKVTVEISSEDLSFLLKRKAVYAIFAQSKESLKPINCRYVGETDNLEERTQAHFRDDEQNECLKDFMQSEKTKIMIYELMPNSDKSERFEKEEEWINNYKPKCNK